MPAISELTIPQRELVQTIVHIFEKCTGQLGDVPPPFKQTDFWCSSENIAALERHEPAIRAWAKLPPVQQKMVSEALEADIDSDTPLAPDAPVSRTLITQALQSLSNEMTPENISAMERSRQGVDNSHFNFGTPLNSIEHEPIRQTKHNRPRLNTRSGPVTSGGSRGK